VGVKRRIGSKRDFRIRLLIAAAGMVAVAGPVVFNLANASKGAAQSNAAAGSPVAFEVISVKPSDPKRGDAGGSKGENTRPIETGFHVEHRSFTATNLSLFGLIVKAYGLAACRPLGGGNCVLLSGGPDWMKKEGFNIQAKMPDGSPDYTLGQFQNGQAPQLQLMLQSLLADRFHLKVHREKRRLSVYALTIGKKGPKLKKAKAGDEPKLLFLPSTQPNGESIIQLVVRNGSMQELADLYSKFMDRPVLDRTGYKDRFDLMMDYEANTDAPGPFSAVTGPGLFRAFQDQAGLKLEATRDLVEILVIDHAEHPSEN